MKRLLLTAALTLAASLATAKPLVLLDPGHGGADAGVKADGFRESDFALDLAKRMEALLKAKGCDVRKTRDSDAAVSLTARVEMANALQPLALVSLHANAAFQPLAKGARVFTPYEGKVDDAAAPLWEQAASLHAAASRTLGLSIAKALGLGGGKPVQSLKLGLFRGLSVPACLVEVEFASQPEGLASLKDEAWRQALAEKLATAVAAYVQAPATEAAGAAR